MIRKLALALAAVALAGAAGGAFAGDGVCGGDCANACPLARQVNECRSTGGEARFMPPTRPTPWAGVRSCLHYGHV